MDKNTEKIILPLISVNICTYNRANMLPKALDSILAQTYNNMEIIIVDDASRDDTEEIVAEYIKKDSRIKYYKNPNNLGITKSRNYALSISNGKYIAVLDSDDYWINENKILEQMAFLENNPDHALVGTYTNFINQDGDITSTFEPELTDSKIRSKILLQNQFVQSSVLFRKDSLPSYNEEYYIWEDYAAWLTMGIENKFANLPTITTVYLEHTSNISKRDKMKGIKTLHKIIKANRKNYPNFFIAYIKNLFRFILAI